MSELSGKCDIRHMRCFVAVAEDLNFRQAAERLNLAQPALSRTIRQLEETLKVRLFERTSRRVELTEAGEVFLKGCQRILAEVEKLAGDTQRAHGGDRGHLTIGHTGFAINGVLPTVMQEFRARFPEITVQLMPMVTGLQLEALRRGDIEIGFMTGPISEPGCEQLTVQNERLVAVLPKTHPLTRLRSVPLARLANEPFVAGTASDWSHYLSHLFAVCQSAGFRPQIVQEAYDGSGILGLVAANMGVTLYVEGARDHFRKGVAIRALQGTDYRVPTVAVWHSAQVPPALQRFIDFAAGWAKAQGIDGQCVS